MYRRDETIASAMDGLDDPRFARVVPERHTKLADRLAEASLPDHRVVPHGIQQFVSGQELTRALGEVAQELPRPGSEIDRIISPPYPSRPRIEAERGEVQQIGVIPHPHILQPTVGLREI